MSDVWLQFLPLLFWVVISVIPSVKLLRRTGVHVALAAFNIFPLTGTVVLVWIVAYSKWPKVAEGKAIAVFE